MVFGAKLAKTFRKKLPSNHCERAHLTTDLVMAAETGKLKDRDEMISRLLKWLPWITFFLVTLPAPIIFLLLFLTASATDTAAFYLVFAVLSFGVGALIGLLIVLAFFLYRRHWLSRLRNRLAEDGITANEVPWFRSELTSAERRTLDEVQQQNPLLADAYCETLAARLTASRIVARARTERLKVERRMNRARALVGADTSTLLNELQADHQQLERLRNEATARLAEARARLQTIESAASRSMNRRETDLMLQRLTESQSHFPLAIEMARLEQQMLKEAEAELNTTPLSNGSSESPTSSNR